MPVEMRMWRIDGDEPKPLTASVLPAEKDLHEFLKRDPSLLGERLLVIGSEVITPYGSRLDLLAIDAEGNLNLLELKRDKTPPVLYRAACVHALTARTTKDRDLALRLLRDALRLGYGAGFLADDKDLDPIRTLPEFRRLQDAMAALQRR